jgi:hypothetical protein
VTGAAGEPLRLARCSRTLTCAAQKLDAQAEDARDATRLDLRSQGIDDRSVLDLLRSLRKILPRAPSAENFLLRHQLILLRRSSGVPVVTLWEIGEFGAPPVGSVR